MLSIARYLNTMFCAAKTPIVFCSFSCRFCVGCGRLYFVLLFCAVGARWWWISVVFSVCLLLWYSGVPVLLLLDDRGGSASVYSAAGYKRDCAW